MGKLSRSQSPRGFAVKQVVAMVDGMATSIYDGLTVYPLGQTVFQLAEEDHRGGLYCFSSVSQITLLIR